MTLVKKIKDKKVNFEFNKEFIKVVTDKIANNDSTGQSRGLSHRVVRSIVEIFNVLKKEPFLQRML